MLSSTVTLGCLAIAGLVSAQTATTTGGSGYTGYNLTLQGDQDSAIFSTDDTNPDAGVNEPDPDVYLNASLYVGEIDIEVDNITAKVNLDAQVLSLLKFNAGVDVSIDRVNLLIQNVTAKVLLEARLENLVQMIGDVLDSIDLNPIIATLGQDVGDIADTAVGGLEGTATGAVSRRSFELQENIIYSTNNYVGNTHTNRILTQTGSIVDESLDNDGNIHGEKTIGSYKSLMTFNGHESTTTFQGQEVTEREYSYMPFHGIMSVSAIYTDASGEVVGTRVLVESNGGGSSTIAADL